MVVLILKNHDKRLVKIEKFSVTDYVFPDVKQAEERGQSMIDSSENEYNAFYTMDVNHFIETMFNKFGEKL